MVNDFYQTNIPGYYAIGDVTKGQALAHVASAEGILCVEKIAGHTVEPLDYGNIPGCTYCSPEVLQLVLQKVRLKRKDSKSRLVNFLFQHLEKHRLEAIQKAL